VARGRVTGAAPPRPAGPIGYLGLGSNLGDRRGRLQQATDALADQAVVALACSSVYETSPVGAVADQPAFLNAALRICTSLAPEELLEAVKAVEREVGRSPGGRRHGPREIDVDVLLLGGVEHRSPQLTVPHPGLLDRRFALIPLLELDFELAAPRSGSLADALAALAVAEQDVRWAGPPLLTPDARRCSRPTAPSSTPSPP